MKIKTYTVGKFSTIHLLRLGQAAELLNKVLADPTFADAVASLDPEKYFTGTKDKPVDLAKMIQMDRECGVNVAVWFVPWYKRYTSAIAYESNNRTNIRSSYLENGRISDLAATLFHEWTHSIGYHHDFWATKTRPYSVPYALGSVISQFAEVTK
jgi:hypothetical protein